MSSNEFLDEGKKIAGKGKEWLSTASTSTLIITAVIIAVLFFTGIWRSIFSLLIVIGLGIIAYFIVVSIQKSKNNHSGELNSTHDYGIIDDDDHEDNRTFTATSDGSTTIVDKDDNGDTYTRY